MEDVQELFTDYHKQLNNELAKSREAFDRTLTLISSGGLALSLTFVEKLGGADSPFIAFLVLSWIAFALTLMCTLYTHLISSRAYEFLYSEHRNLNHIDPNKVEELITHLERSVSKLKSENKRVKRYRDIAFRSICFGVSLLILFVSLNILYPSLRNILVIKTPASQTGDLTTEQSKDSAGTAPPSAQQPKEVKEEASK